MAKNNTSYKETMDSIHASASLVEKTLNCMNEELNSAGSTRIIPKVLFKRVCLYAATAAACIAVLLGARQLLSPNNSISFSDINTSGILQISDAVRGSSSDISVSELEKHFSIDLQKLVRGYSLMQPSAGQIRTPDKTLSYIIAEYCKNEADYLRVEVSDFVSPLYSSMLDLGSVSKEGTSLRFAKDNNTGMLYAAWEKNGTYYTLSSNSIKQDEFVDIAEQLAQVK